MRFALILALIVSMLVVAPTAEAQRRSRGSGNRKVSSLRGQLSTLRHRKEALKRQLRMNRAQKKQTLQEIAQVDQQLNIVEGELQQTEAKLGESRDQQKVVGGQLRDAQAQLTEVTKQVKQRLRRMYVSGPTSTLSVLLGSHTAGELASRSDMMSLIARSDNRVFTEYKALKMRVEDRKRAADALVQRISTLVTQQKQQQDALESARQTKQGKVRQLEAQEEELEDAIAQFERDEAQISAQIAEFMRRMQRSGTKLPPFLGGLSRPVPGVITSGFGLRYHPILHKTRMHKGVDFRAPSGTPVRAAASGVVVASQYMRGYGNVVLIAHGSNISTLYAHLSRSYVRAGQSVQRGQVVAASGSTGLSTAPHLHFEVHDARGRAINPLGRL